MDEDERFFDRMKLHDEFTVFLILLSFFIVVTFLVYFDLTQPFDSKAITAISSLTEGALFTSMFIITQMGDLIFLVPGTLLVLFFLLLHGKKILPSVFLSMMIGIVPLIGVTKMVFARPRPEIALLEVANYSYPSGHTISSFTFFIGSYLFLSRYIIEEDKLWFKILMVSCITATALVGLSRLFLGVHYITDVVGGYLLGGAWVLLFIKAYEFLISDIPRDEH